MSLDGQIRALAKGLHESAIDLGALLQDCKAGSVDDVDLSLRYATLRSGYQEDVVAWAIAKYGIDKEYLLTTTDGHELGKIDLTEDMHSNSEEISYGSALRKLRKLGGLELDEESQQVLYYCERRGGSTPIAAVNLLVSKKLGEEVDVLEAYLLEKGFEKGKFQAGSGEITGEIPEGFLGKVDQSYAVASSVFGQTVRGQFDTVTIDVKNTGRAVVNIHLHEAFPVGKPIATRIEDKEKAHKILTALTSYVL